ITQTYNGSGAPTNMLVYHAWMDISTYTGPSDGGIVSRTLTDNTTLQPGTYRLRVDTLNNDGSIPASGSKSQGYKAYAVRAVDASGNPCADCTVSAWNDIDVSTSVTFGAGNSFVMPLVAVPPDYAGQTVTIDLFDVGDMAGKGTVNVSIVDPSGNVATAPAGST